VAKGRKQRLLEAVLTASFRPDRQGRLLLDEALPASLPITGNDEAHAAWAALVKAQERYTELGAPDPWGFSGLVRKLHTELASGEVTSEERFRLLCSLSFGPWRLVASEGVPWGEPTHSDEELRRHWEWARFEEPSPSREWSERDWGWQRFVHGLEPKKAFAARRRAEDVLGGRVDL